MKLLLIICIILPVILSSCNQKEDYRTPGRHVDIEKLKDYWKVIGQAKVLVSTNNSFSAVSPVTTTVTYTEVEKGTFNLTPGTLSETEIDDDSLTLGTVEISKIKVNKLKVCGPGGNQKCTVAAIRAYTTGSTIEGLVNTSEGYGAPVSLDSNLLGLETVGAAVLTSYTIPAHDNRLRNNDFSDLIYDLEVDLSNAGAGNYTMELVIELVVGL